MLPLLLLSEIHVPSLDWLIDSQSFQMKQKAFLFRPRLPQKESQGLKQEVRIDLNLCELILDCLAINCHHFNCRVEALVRVF